MRYRTPPVVVTGDLSADGRPDELDAVAAELARFDDIPRVVITGHRDLAQRRATGRGAQPPVDSDLDYFLALEPALTLGFDDPPRGDPDDRDGSGRGSGAAWPFRYSWASYPGRFAGMNARDEPAPPAV